MLELMLLALVIALFLQPTQERSMIAFLFVGITILHYLLFADVSGLLYYSSAALFDLAIIVCTSCLTRIPKVIVNLHKICFLFVLLNFIGWLMWYFYYSPVLYNTACSFLYLAAFFVLLTGSHGFINANIRSSSRYVNFLISCHTRLQRYSKDSK